MLLLHLPDVTITLNAFQHNGDDDCKTNATAPRRDHDADKKNVDAE